MLILSLRFFRTIKKRSFTRHYSNETAFMAYADVSTVKSRGCLRLDLIGDPAIIRLTILNTMLFVVYDEKEFMKTIAFTK